MLSLRLALFKRLGGISVTFLILLIVSIMRGQELFIQIKDNGIAVNWLALLSAQRYPQTLESHFSQLSYDWLAFTSQVSAMACTQSTNQSPKRLCLWSDIAEAAISNEWNYVQMRLNESTLKAPQRQMLAIFAGNIADSLGNHTVAFDFWQSYSLEYLVLKANRAVIDEDFERAQKLLARLDQGYLSETPEIQQRLSIALQNLAKHSERQMKFSDAEHYWRWLLREFPLHAYYHARLGQSLTKQAKWSEAVSAYKTAVQLAPDEITYYVGLANALDQIGKAQDASEIRAQIIEVERRKLFSTNTK